MMSTSVPRFCSGQPASILLSSTVSSAAHGTAERVARLRKAGRMTTPLRSNFGGRRITMPQRPRLSPAEKCRALTISMGWTQVPGGLKTISSGDEKSVIGTDDLDNVWLYNGSSWDQLPGKKTQVSVGLSGIWAVDADNVLFEWDEPAQEFVEVKTGVKIAQVAVGQDVYILDILSNIYKYLGNEKWVQLDGKLQGIDTNDYGDLWGTQSGELRKAFRRNNGAWLYIPGPNGRDVLKQVSTGVNGVWAIDAQNNVYRWVLNSTLGAWKQEEGALKYISSGYPSVWGVDPKGNVYKYSAEGGSAPSPQAPASQQAPAQSGPHFLRLCGVYTQTPGPRHSAYPAHLDPRSNDTKIGDYLAYSNDLYNVDGITDPGPGKREKIGLSTGVCTVIQQPSEADKNTVYQCYTSLQFQEGKYAGSSLFLAIVFSDTETPAYSIIGGSGYFKTARGQATQEDETPFTSPYGEYYINLEYYLSPVPQSGQTRAAFK